MAASDSSKRDKFFTVRNVLFVGAGNKRVRRFVVSSYCHALSEFLLSHHDVHAEPAGSDPLRITMRHSLRRHIHSRWGRADGGPTDTADLCSRCVVSGPANDDSPTFSPDGNTTFFTRSTANWGAIVESHLVNGHWTQPALAPFSSEWPDASPAMSPDGSYLVFESNRPAIPLASLPKGGEVIPRVASDLWRVDRVGTGWSKSTRLSDAVNLVGQSISKSLPTATLSP